MIPWLERIDATRWYTGGGNLNAEFEERLARHARAGAVVTVANATLGLALALMAQSPPAGSLCMLPAWTFAASAHAVRLAGLEPWLVDADPVGWHLSPEAAETYLSEAPARVGAVMPVMPFGSPADLSGWDAFRRRTGIAVAIDAAAAFDTVRAAGVPAVVSLHATKVLGVGEGGFVASSDRDLIAEIKARANFGFRKSREASVAGLNAKLSEYAAAVGLAALDDWPEARGSWRRVALRYAEELKGSPITVQPDFGADWISSTAMVDLKAVGAAGRIGRLAEAGIATRRWWGKGLHRQEAFADCRRVALSTTEMLAETTIGLPCWPDLPDADITKICRIVRG